MSIFGFFGKIFGSEDENPCGKPAQNVQSGSVGVPLQNLEDFVMYVSKMLVDYPDEVKVKTETGADDAQVIQIICRQSDRGKLIGKKGKTIMALRALVSGAAGRTKNRVSVEVLDDEVEEGHVGA